MSKQVEFINRENELALIDSLIQEWGTLHFLFIDASGGIGKTRLLQRIVELYKSGKHDRFLLTDIIDFDDRFLHVAENLGIRIANTLDRNIFARFLRDMDDYRKMESAGVSHDRLEQEFDEGTQCFVDCFNILSSQKRIVLLFDTIEKIDLTDYFEYLSKTFQKLNNSVMVLSGRNARQVGEKVKTVNRDIFTIIDLPVLKETAIKEYLQKKQDDLHITLEAELIGKLIELSGGKPIIIDLSVEWLSKNSPPKWLLACSIEEIKTRRKEFEQILVLDIAQTRSPIDNLILMMSRVYPLNQRAIAELLSVSDEEAEALFQQAKKYVFVKILPDDRITLHDEMRRMINEYVWIEVDPDGDRRKDESKEAIKYFEQCINSYKNNIDKLFLEEKNAQKTGNVVAKVAAFSKRIALEREIWILKAELLKHSLIIDINQGVKTFIDTFDEATKTNQLNSREALIIEINSYIGSLSKTYAFEVNMRRAKSWFYKGEYQKVVELTTNLIIEDEIIPEHRVESLLLRGNSKIRLANVEGGLSDFQNAIKISKDGKLINYFVKANNATGWSYRLIGDFENAKRYLLEAKNACIDEKGNYRDGLADDYGLILNNLSYVLSNDNKDRRTAINIARSAIAHWKEIKNDIGLGAAYLVLGIVHYRYDHMEKALEDFKEALNIFEPLNMVDWLGQIYSWRGAVYEDLNKYLEAEYDLKKSLDIGTANIKAMTLNRLGRVYMYMAREYESQKKYDDSKQYWDLAEKKMQESLEWARRIPDRVYELGSIGSLAAIKSEKGEFDAYDEFNKMVSSYLKKIVNPDLNSLGIAYLDLSKLAIGKSDKILLNEIITFLKKGIELVTKHGSYGRTDIVSRLADVERIFCISDAELIQEIGKKLKIYFLSKEKEDLDFSVVIPILDKWEKWGGHNKNE